jgi:hypothetical protein
MNPAYPTIFTVCFLLLLGWMAVFLLLLRDKLRGDNLAHNLDLRLPRLKASPPSAQTYLLRLPYYGLCLIGLSAFYVLGSASTPHLKSAVQARSAR